MQSHIKFSQASVLPEHLTLDALHNYSNMPLRMAKAQKFTIDQGDILVQSISHYLARIELFEYNLNREACIDFMVTEPMLFMYLKQSENACYMGYWPTGKYKKVVPAGVNRRMMIIFRPEWLIHKCQHLPELNKFTALFNGAEQMSITLSSFPIAESLFSTLKKIDTKISDLHMDAKGYVFINDCINKYYNQLAGRKNCINQYHQHKATAIASFIRENYATELVDDLAKLAARFMVSERSMARLAKMAFGIPLHEHVINIRMASALYQLSTTNKPIFEIARLNGYREAHYFSRAFKKHHGVAPTHIKRPSKKMETEAVQGTILPKFQI